MSVLKSNGSNNQKVCYTFKGGFSVVKQILNDFLGEQNSSRDHPMKWNRSRVNLFCKNNKNPLATEESVVVISPRELLPARCW